MARDVYHREHSYSFLTQWGPITAIFNQEGLANLHFDNTTAHRGNDSILFKQTFVKWLAQFQTKSPNQQWCDLAPEGTKFQKSVWRTLMDLPIGQRTSYKEIASRIGSQKAIRAVGTAIAKNPIAVLIPCHRIVHTSGEIGNYRWGSDRKLALLEAEQENNIDLLTLFK